MRMFSIRLSDWVLIFGGRYFLSSAEASQVFIAIVLKL